jgi:hypothetical protein
VFLGKESEKYQTLHKNNLYRSPGYKFIEFFIRFHEKAAGAVDRTVCIRINLCNILPVDGIDKIAQNHQHLVPGKMAGGYLVV